MSRIALEKTMAITQTVNDAKEKHDNMGEMFEVATQFAGRVECAIVAPDRRFYKKGPLFRSPKVRRSVASVKLTVDGSWKARPINLQEAVFHEVTRM